MLTAALLVCSPPLQEALEAFEALQTAMAAAQAGCAQQQQGGLEAAREWVQGRIEEYGLRWRVRRLLPLLCVCAGQQQPFSARA